MLSIIIKKGACMQKSRFSVHSKTSLRSELTSYGGQGSSYLPFALPQTSSQQVEKNIPTKMMHSIDTDMQRIIERLHALCSRSNPIMISGEKGCGKTTIARMIAHSMGDQNIPFEVFFPKDVETSAQEKTLFGSSWGAPSHNEVQGHWQKAYGGVCIIDDVSALTLSLQNKITKFLKDKDARKKGAMQHQEPRLIIMAPSNIEELVEKNKVKLDLYRLFFSSHLRIPPLRKRPRDIPPLIETFLSQWQQESKKITLSGEAMALLVNYEWPQNISELKTVLEKACKQGENVYIQKQDIPLVKEAPEPQNSDDWIQSLPVGQALRLVETHFILETIKANRGNRTYAARSLGISLRTLRNKINEFTVEGYEVMSPQSGRRSA